MFVKKILNSQHFKRQNALKVTRIISQKITNADREVKSCIFAMRPERKTGRYML